MSFRTLKGYVVVLVTGAALFAAALLVVLQWRLRAEFSLFGQPYSIRMVDDGKLMGGINTAALMLMSGVGGLVVAGLGWLMLRGIRSLRTGRRADARRGMERRLEKIERSGPADESP